MAEEKKVDNKSSELLPLFVLVYIAFLLWGLLSLAAIILGVCSYFIELEKVHPFSFIAGGIVSFFVWLLVFLAVTYNGD